MKIDFNKRRVKEKVVKVIPKLFSDVPLFTLFVLSEKEILTEKIRTLINRSESRDLYDIWVLLNKGIKIDLSDVSFDDKKTTFLSIDKGAYGTQNSANIDDF